MNKSLFHSKECVNSLEVCESEGLQKASRGTLLHVKTENQTKNKTAVNFLFDPQQIHLFQQIWSLFILFLLDQRKT